MKTCAQVLVVDDVPQNIRLMEAVLTPAGYEVTGAGSGSEALSRLEDSAPDVVVLDLVMPEMDGLEVCRRIRANPATSHLPVVMVTASDQQDKVQAIEAGADDFLTKPLNQAELLARVNSLRRLKEYHDTVQQQTEALAALNSNLEARVTDQVRQIERLSRLRRFLSPQLSDLLLASDDDRILDSHRREVAVLCSDLSGFSELGESAEPEEVMRVLSEYYGAFGTLVDRHQATVGSFDSARIRVYFNDPLTCEEPTLRAVKLALDMKASAADLGTTWTKRGHDLGFSAGVSLGFATLGEIEFGGRWDYGVIGATVNLASSLCEEARPGQIILSQRAYSAVEELAKVENVGPIAVQGLSRPLAAYNVLSLLDRRNGAYPDGLSQREVEVIRCVSAGRSNPQVSEELVISLNTVTRHISNIFDKTGVTNRTELAGYAHKHGLV